MNQLDKYRFNKKLKELGKFSWDTLVIFSKLIIFIFFLVTAFTFWQNTAIDLYLKYQVDLFKQVGMMFLTVLILIILVGIDMLKNLKNEK